VDEVRRGAINHAIRFTAEYIQRAYQFPAGHLVGGSELTVSGAGLLQSAV